MIEENATYVVDMLYKIGMEDRTMVEKLIQTSLTRKFQGGFLQGYQLGVETCLDIDINKIHPGRGS